MILHSYVTKRGHCIFPVHSLSATWSRSAIDACFSTFPVTGGGCEIQNRNQLRRKTGSSCALPGKYKCWWSATWGSIANWNRIPELIRRAAPMGMKISAIFFGRGIQLILNLDEHSIIVSLSHFSLWVPGYLDSYWITCPNHLTYRLSAKPGVVFVYYVVIEIVRWEMTALQLLCRLHGLSMASLLTMQKPHSNSLKLQLSLGVVSANMAGKFSA